jgi:23S rRNA pseudouridine2605 synthase
LLNSNRFCFIFFGRRKRKSVFADCRRSREQIPMKTSRGPGRVSLPRALSKLGFASHAEALRLIQSGVVSVNKKKELNPHRWVDLKRDVMEVKSEPVQRQAFRYILLHKPKGFVTTRSDERGQATVFELLGERGKGLSPVGRLDKETTGLLLFTNDHQLANRVTSPDTNLPKTYVADLDRPLDRKDLASLTNGVPIRIEGRTSRTKPAQVAQVAAGNVEISISEGKNRQIRRMLEELGYSVLSLRRISVGPLDLGELEEGNYRELMSPEIASLRDAVRPPAPPRKRRRSR